MSTTIGGGINKKNANISSSSTILGAGVGVAVFILLLCFIGIPLISILVIVHSKKQRTKQKKGKSQSQGSPLHLSTYEQIELNGLNGNGGSASIGVSNRSRAMLTCTNAVCHPDEGEVPRHNLPQSAQAICNTAITTQSDAAKVKSTYEKIRGDFSRKKAEYFNVDNKKLKYENILALSHDKMGDIYPHPCSTPPNENMHSTQLTTRSKLPPDRPLPAVPLCTYAEEDTHTTTTAPKKKKKRKKKRESSQAIVNTQVTIEADSDAPPVPPQTVDCLYTAVIKKTKGED